MIRKRLKKGMKRLEVKNLHIIEELKREIRKTKEAINP